MNTPFNKSIAVKLLLIVLGLYGIVTLTVTTGHFFLEYRQHKDKISDNLNQIQQAFEGGFTDSIWKMDQEALEAAVRGIIKIPSIEGIKILNTENKFLATCGIFKDNNQIKFSDPTINVLGETDPFFYDKKYPWDLFEHSFSLEKKDSKGNFFLGRATIYSSSAIIYDYMKLQLILLTLNMVFTLTFFAIVLSWAVKRYLGKPLGTLAKATKNVNLDNLASFSVAVKAPEGSELKILEDSFTEMIQNLSQSVEERKATEEELEEALIESEDLRYKAEEANRLKTAFLASLGHEIRTPMNGILGFANLLQDDDITGDEQAQYIKTIQKSGKRMLHILNDLIDISKIESEQIHLAKEKTSVNNLLTDLYVFFRSQAAAKNIDFSYSKSLPDEESFIEIDKVKIYQVLSNLLSNALKFTEHGKICFGYTKKENILEFYVKDTGIGIAPDLHSVIFERFRQIETDYSQKHEGAGLGLAISQAFIKKHNGEIRLESEPHQGSTFYFTLPYK